MSLYQFHKYALKSKESTLNRLKGSNQKALLVVLKADEKTSIPFLQKILQAIKMDWNEDILVLEITPEEQIKLSDIWNNHEIQHILSFGVAPKKLGLNFKISPYELIDFQSRKMVFTHNLSFLENPKNIAYKKTLWNTLKSLFLNAS